MSGVLVAVLVYLILLECADIRYAKRQKKYEEEYEKEKKATTLYLI